MGTLLRKVNNNIKISYINIKEEKNSFKLKGGLFTDFTDKNSVYQHSRNIIYGRKNISDNVLNIKFPNYLTPKSQNRDFSQKGSSIITSINSLQSNSHSSVDLRNKLAHSHIITILPTKQPKNPNKNLLSANNVITQNHLYRIKDHFENQGLIHN